MNEAWSTVIISVLGSGGLLAVWLNTRAQSKQTIENAKVQSEQTVKTAQQASEEAVRKQGGELFELFKRSNAEDREEFNKQRAQWAADRAEMLKTIKLCEDHRDADAERYAKLQADMAYVRGRFESLLPAGALQPGVGAPPPTGPATAVLTMPVSVLASSNPGAQGG